MKAKMKVKKPKYQLALMYTISVGLAIMKQKQVLMGVRKPRK